MPAQVRSTLPFRPYLWISIALFFPALALPAYYQGTKVVYGVETAALGWLGFIDGHFSWFANPLYLGAVLLSLANPHRALRWAVVALVLACTFMFRSGIIYDEAHGDGAISGLGWGYFCWLMAMLFAVLGLVRPSWPGYLKPGWLEVAVLAAALLAFNFYWFHHPTGYWQQKSKLEHFMAINCGEAKQMIEHTLPEVRLLYMPEGNSSLSSYLLTHTDLQEIQTQRTSRPGVKVLRGPDVHEAEKLDSPTARYQYDVNTQFPVAASGAWASRARIVDRETGEEVASSTSYGYLPIGGSAEVACGEPAGPPFIVKVLSLRLLTEQETTERVMNARKAVRAPAL